MSAYPFRHTDHPGATMNVRVLLLLGAIFFAGCVAAAPPGSPATRRPAAPATRGPASPAPGEPGTSPARLVRTGTHVVILSHGRASREDGTTLSVVGPNAPAGQIAEALTSSSGSDLIYVAVRDAVSITVSTSLDGGATWETVPAPDVQGQQAIADVAAAKVGDRMTILLDEASSTAISSGT